MGSEGSLQLKLVNWHFWTATIGIVLYNLWMTVRVAEDEVQSSLAHQPAE